MKNGVDLVDPGASAPVLCYVGTEDVRMRIPMLRVLRRKGFKVVAIGSEESDPFDREGIPYQKYRINRWIGPLGDLRSIWQLRSHFNRIKPDVVHAFDTKPCILAPIAARWASVPVAIKTITGMGYIFSSNSLVARILKPVYRNLHRITSGICDMTIFQNPYDQSYFLDHRMVKPARQCVIRSSGIDISAYLGVCGSDEEVAQLRLELGLSKRTVVIMIARLVKEKGVIEYLKAAKLVRKSFPDTAFLLVGPSVSEGKQAVSQEEIEDYRDDVRYLGTREDVASLLKLSDLCILPSYYREGVPRVLLEACAMSLPIITTDMPGCREVIRHGENGYLVKPRDVNSLAEGIRQFLQLSSDDRAKMGKVSSQIVEQEFELGIVTNRYAEVYSQALSVVAD